MAPTFAHIVLEDEVVRSADLRFADAGASESVTTQGLIRRLSQGETRG
jgi:hypothetical protein